MLAASLAPGSANTLSQGDKGERESRAADVLLWFPHVYGVYTSHIQATLGSSLKPWGLSCWHGSSCLLPEGLQTPALIILTVSCPTLPGFSTPTSTSHSLSLMARQISAHQLPCRHHSTPSALTSSFPIQANGATPILPWDCDIRVLLVPLPLISIALAPGQVWHIATAQ